MIPPEADPAGVAWLTQQPIFVPDVERETRFPEIVELVRSDGTRSFCVFPLTSPVRRLGALGFKSRETDAFHDVDPEFLQQLTDEVALAVDNALHQESAEKAERRLRQERDRLGMLLEINNALVSNLDPRALFDDIAACLRRVVAHDLTALMMYDSERNGFRVAAVAFENKEIVQEGEFFPMDDDAKPALAAFRAGTPLRVGRDVIATIGARNRPILAELGIQSACLLPMSARGRRIGAIVVGRLRGEPFSDDDVDILAAAAGQIAFAVENALAFQEIAALRDKLALEKVYLEDELRSHYDFEEIVGESPALKAVLAQVETVGPTSSTVLIRGETGTGKELIARAIHELSPRKARTLVKMNCAAIPTGLLESELFGHERGAFTGAIAQKIGRFELADGGTLFLDEVGDIPLELQPKLLRVLQEQRVRAARQHADEACGRADRGSDASEPRGDGRGGDVSQRPLLPLERLPDRAASASRAARRHPSPRAILRAEIRARNEEDDRHDPERGDERACRLRLARQRARARKRDRARGDPHERIRAAGSPGGVPQAQQRSAACGRHARSDRARSDSQSAP